jgi:prefoldin alpha subunit
MEDQEAIFKLGMMEQQLNQLQQQLQSVVRGISELESLDLGLDEINQTKDKEIFAQIGKGIYIKSKLISENLVINVGDNNFVNRTVPEVKELIRSQIKRLKEVELELSNNINSINSEFLSMIQEYQNHEKEEKL